MTTTRIKMLAMAMLTAVILLSGCTAAKNVTTTEDTSWMYHDTVDAAFVKAHLSVPMPKTVMLIDARPYRGKYIKGHIPGSISIPFSEFDKKIDLLPKDKNTLLIYYCEGPACKLSHQSAVKAEKLGYKNVKVYTQGYPEWVSIKGNYGAVSIEQVESQIADNTTVIVDSRPQKTKYDKGHIPSAISIPFTQFDALSGKLPRNPDTPILFYCGGLDCRLSHKSAVKAIEMGYTHVKVYDRGYPEWKKIHGTAGNAIQAKAGEVEGAIDIEQFKSIVSTTPDAFMIIDVRDADEFAKGSFTGAVNIPVEQLEPKIKDLPDTKPIVFVCSTGARSGEAYYMVKDVRESLKDVHYIEAQIKFKGNGAFEIKPAQ